MTTNETLTAETVTRSQIRKLGIEAFERNDLAMFDATARALDGDANSVAVCVDAINAARAAQS